MSQEVAIISFPIKFEVDPQNADDIKKQIDEIKGDVTQPEDVEALLEQAQQQLEDLKDVKNTQVETQSLQEQLQKQLETIDVGTADQEETVALLSEIQKQIDEIKDKKPPEVDSDSLKELVRQQVEEIKEETTPQEDAESLLEGEIPDIDQEALKELTDFIKTTDKQGLQTLSKFAKNPTNMVEGQLMGILGKAGIHGALAAAIIGVIIGTPEIIRTIVKALAVKGGPLNQDFHRFFEEENQLGLTRDLQYRRATGLDVVITNDNRGLILVDPGFVGNNLVDVDSTRAIRDTTKSSQYGYVNGM